MVQHGLFLVAKWETEHAINFGEHVDHMWNKFGWNSCENWKRDRVDGGTRNGTGARDGSKTLITQKSFRAKNSCEIGNIFTYLAPHSAFKPANGTMPSFRFRGISMSSRNRFNTCSASQTPKKRSKILTENRD